MQRQGLRFAGGSDARTHAEAELPHGMPRRGPTRRQFLHACRAAGGWRAPGAARAFLAAVLRRAGRQLVARRHRRLKIASPQTPVTWDIPADNTADRRRPGAREGRHAAALQLRRLHRPGRDQVVREEVPQTKVQVSTFNDTDEALTKIRGGNVDYDIYFPSYDQISRMVTAKLIRPLNHSYIPNIKQRLADVHEPLVRPGVAVHGALHRLHHRHRLADRPGARRHRRADQSLRRRSGIRSTRARPRSSTTGTPRWRMVLLRAGQAPTSTPSNRRRSEDDRRAD